MAIVLPALRRMTKLAARRPNQVGQVRGAALPMWLLVHLLNRFIRNGVMRLIAARGSRVGVILSGGNVDLKLIAELVP